MDIKENVMIVHNYYQIPGGEDTVVLNEKRMLEKNGHKVIVYSRNNNELKQMSILRKLSLPITTVFNPRTFIEVRNIIKKENIDIIHIHNTLNLISPSVYYAARAMNIPIVQTIHNFRLMCPNATFYRDGHICEDCVFHGLKCAVKHNCYRNSKLQTIICVLSMWIHRLTGIYGQINYICLTKFNKNKLLSIRQVKKERVFIKPNFVRKKDKIIPQEKRKNQFVFAGRLDKIKGIDILFNAWNEMGSSAPKLIVCGTGPLEEWCKSFIKLNDVNIELLGFVPNEAAIKIISSSKGLILPTQWYEGFPMSVVEAFSVGTPVVCSDIGNVGNIVKEGINGCKFKSNSIKDLIFAINRCENLYKSTIVEFNSNYTELINYHILRNIYRKVSMFNKKEIK